jgi:hypothetical protein
MAGPSWTSHQPGHQAQVLPAPGSDVPGPRPVARRLGASQSDRPWANIDGEEPIDLVSAVLRPMLRATFGFSVVPDQNVKDLDLATFDALAIPGGFEGAGFYDDALPHDFSEVIRNFEAAGKPIASACVAALALGAAGTQ